MFRDSSIPASVHSATECPPAESVSSSLDKAATPSNERTQQPVTSNWGTIRVLWRCDKPLGDPNCTNKQRPGLHGGDYGRFEMMHCADPSYALQTIQLTADELFERARVVLAEAAKP